MTASGTVVEALPENIEHLVPSCSENGLCADDERDAHHDGYHFSSPEERESVKAQRAAVWQWLKGIGMNLLKEGVNLTGVSLPVQLFEPKSFLERLSDSWGYLDLLLAAANTSDPGDRMRYMVGFVISGLRRQVSTQKPFNPILGETYQGKFDNGVAVYCEQISHHPPISSWQVDDPNNKFIYHGNGHYVASARGNAVKAQQTGVNTVKFTSDGATITWEQPHITVKGVLFGERVLKFGGTIHLEDKQNNIICDVVIDPTPQGGIVGSLTSLWRAKKNKHTADEIKGTLLRNGQAVDTCSGSWLHHVEWEKGCQGGKLKTVWDINYSVVHLAEPVPNPLDSDCRHREDQSYLKQGDVPKAQEWKLILEERQRRDKRLRKEGWKEHGIDAKGH